MKKKYLIILVPAIISIILFIILAAIPYFNVKNIDLDRSYDNQHLWGGSNIYSLQLEKDQNYTISLTVDPFWGMDTSLRISNSPYMIEGQEIDDSDTNGEVMIFEAPETDTYYIQVLVKSGSGYYSLQIDSGVTSTQSSAKNEFIDIIYILIMVFPSILIIIGSLIIYFIYSKKQKNRDKTNFHKNKIRDRKKNIYKSRKKSEEDKRKIPKYEQVDLDKEISEIDKIYKNGDLIEARERLETLKNTSEIGTSSDTMTAINRRINFINKKIVKRTILNMSTKFPRVNVQEISEKARVKDKNLIAGVIKEMINENEVYAEFFDSTQSLLFDQQANIDEIDHLMETYKKWEDMKKDKKDL